MTTPLLVLDSPSLTYRAFFALPRTIRDAHGQSVNAVHGYLDMVARLLQDRHPRGAVHTFDADWRPAWRVEAYPGYKSQRREDPPELAGQFELLREVLDAAGLPVLEAAGHEADDVIGTLAARATPQAPVEVVTGDRDLLQTVRDGVVAVLFTVRGVSRLERYDEAAVTARYGVPPALYAEMAMLRGDPSDGLPGVSGVGDKGAAALLRQHGSLDALEAATDLPPRLAGALAGARAYLAAMRRVVPVVTDLDVTVPATRPADAARLRALAEGHRLGGPIRRLAAALGIPDPSGDGATAAPVGG